ncbi:MAG: hypothetical protein IKU03_03510 [Bacteroidales bacterium]|nr:hypothetical protein [Bacteroidales bacterium]
MKKLMALSILLASLLGACENEDLRTSSLELSPNRVITIYGNTRAENSTILMLSIGHDGRYCNGCVMDDGRLIHVNCMGDGNYCATAAAVQLQEVGADLVATTVDTFGLTSEDFFNMPARSLNYVDEDENRVFLNIPAQLVYRDNTTLQFTFTGLSITEEQLYTNE